MKEIAVEKGLSDVSNYLRDNGYKVYEIDIHQATDRDFTQGFDAVVLSGINNNLMGIENTMTKAPVIIASGLNAEEIKSRIETSEM